MSDKKNLNVAPYYDDFDETKDYYKVLFKPEVPVQARELTQTQDYLQNQFDRFGRNIYVPGSIVEGCKITFNSNIPYVKLTDNYANGTSLVVSSLKGNFVQSTNGLRAYVFDTVQGYKITSPDLNTLYVNYLNSSVDGTVKTFQENETLTVYDSSNATIGQIVVANSSISGNSAVTGSGYSVSVANGVIFQDGYFSRVTAQNLIVTKYNNSPDQISVGFKSIQTVVDSNQDTSLLDNSLGYSNYSAPGADRLKITPVLVSRASNTNSTESFFSIVDFVEGNPAVIRQASQYSTLGDAMASRTDDTNGNFIIKPFNCRAVTLYDANTSLANTNYVKLEIDPGLAYVHGYKVETKGKLVNKIRKGNDVGQTGSQNITTTLGNYVFVQEYAGMFNPTTAEKVSLRSATSTAISNNLSKGIQIDSISAAGSEIGIANVLAIEYNSGTQGTAYAQYRLYLTNIVMNPGANFNQVRSIFYNGSPKAVADVILNSANNAVLQETGLSPIVYSFNQAAIKTLKDSNNSVSGQFDFYEETSLSFNTAGVATVTIPSYIGGQNILPYGVGTLDNNTSTDFQISTANTILMAAATGTIVTSNTTVTGVGTSFTSYYQPGNMINLVQGSNNEIRQVVSIANNTSLTVSSAFTNTYDASASHRKALVAGQLFSPSELNGHITINSTTEFTINLNQTFASSFSANLIYRIRRTSASPAKKKLNGPIFVAIDTATHPAGANGPWCLGIPDIVGVNNVYVGDNFSANNPDQAAKCTLDSGQRDTFYSLGYLYKNNATIVSGNKILVSLNAFTPDTSTGIGFYSVDSYPVDDTGSTANTILTQYIPNYFSTYNAYNLRNCIDFRNYAANTIPYIANTGLSAALTANTILNPANTINLISNVYNPVVDSSFQCAYQYYMGRYDKLGFTTKGSVTIVEGTPGVNPTPPADISSGITIATITVPPYPTLTMDDASSGIITFKYNTNKRYTMADIGSLDNQIQQLQYYTALNALETSTKNLLITNSSGQNRTQNGIFAEPFTDFSRCNTLDPYFNIAIDTSNNFARPIFEQNLVNLQYKPVTNDGISVSSDGRIISLTATQNNTPFITQPFSSETRNAAQDTMYVWSGQISLDPIGDYQPDVTVNPAVVVTDDSYSALAALPNMWGTQWGAWEETSSVVTGTSSSSTWVDATRTNLSLSNVAFVSEGTPTNVKAWWETNAFNNVAQGGWTAGDNFANVVVTTTSTSTNYTQTGITKSLVANTNSYNLGTYVTNVALQPYCRAKAIKFHATGMKPNTILYAYIDDTNVTSYCILSNSTYTSNGGGRLITDAAGSIYGIYFMPGNTFLAGERVFKLVDVSNIDTLGNSITTTASTTYYGTNISYAENNVTLNTITPQVVTTTVSNNMTVTSTSSTVTGINYYTHIDPLAQGISIPDEKFGSDDIQGVFVSSIDLFFASKDPVLGVTIMIRDMDNGYPGPNIQNFSSIHLTPSQVNVSSDGSVATNVKFAAPVLLETGTDYCVVIMPDGSNPGYNMWCAKLGGTDLLTKSPIYALVGCGVLFSSSQNSTWTAYQTERLKFNLYIYNFGLTGTATITNDDTEYFSISSINGKESFTLGETVYSVSSDITKTANTTTGVKSILVANGAAFTANTKIVIRNDSTSQVMITNISSVSGNTIYVSDSAIFTSNAAAIGIVTANGSLYGKVTSSNSSFLSLGDSSATSSHYFNVANTYLVGATSGAYANASSLLDITYSTMMPKISASTMNDTNIIYSMTGTSNSALGYITDSSSTGFTYAVSKTFCDEERTVMSKSNEIQYKSGNKSFIMSAQMQSASPIITPFIDTSKLGVLCVHNLINGEVSNSVYTSEIQNSGQAINRYISSTVTLASGMDSEDLIVYLGAYWPADTEIYVYAKLQNTYDPDNFVQKAWTPMSTTNTVRSSSVNQGDINEFIFTLPIGAPTSNNSTAYLDTDNMNIATYVSSSGQVYTSFINFAIKVVLLSNAGSQLVPMISDLRAIALPSSA